MNNVNEVKRMRVSKLPRGRNRRPDHIDTSLVGVRIKRPLREAIEKWSDDVGLDMSFAIRRSLEIGWPIFLERNFDGLKMKPKEEYRT
jgi:hypothetical protein